jgi:hypothetical protein
MPAVSFVAAGVLTDNNQLVEHGTMLARDAGKLADRAQRRSAHHHLQQLLPKLHLLWNLQLRYWLTLFLSLQVPRLTPLLP